MGLSHLVTWTGRVLTTRLLGVRAGLHRVSEPLGKSPNTPLGRPTGDMGSQGHHQGTRRDIRHGKAGAHDQGDKLILEKC